MRKVIWAVTAQNDLHRIERWLERERSPEYAVQILEALRFRCKFLEDFPHGGSPISEGLRKLRVPDTGYIMVYRLVTGATEVIRVFHEREDWQNEA
jgi:plasmid stabilization system protein ParE